MAKLGGCLWLIYSLATQHGRRNVIRRFIFFSNVFFFFLWNVLACPFATLPWYQFPVSDLPLSLTTSSVFFSLFLFFFLAFLSFTVQPAIIIIITQSTLLRSRLRSCNTLPTPSLGGKLWMIIIRLLCSQTLISIIWMLNFLPFFFSLKKAMPHICSSLTIYGRVIQQTY